MDGLLLGPCLVDFADCAPRLRKLTSDYARRLSFAVQRMIQAQAVEKDGVIVDLKEKLAHLKGEAFHWDIPCFLSALLSKTNTHLSWLN